MQFSEVAEISLSGLTEYYLLRRGIGRCFAISGRSEVNQKILINIHEKHNFQLFEPGAPQGHCRGSFTLNSSSVTVFQEEAQMVVKIVKGVMRINVHALYGAPLQVLTCMMQWLCIIIIMLRTVYVLYRWSLCI